MSDPIDTGIAASIGAAIVGAAVALKEAFGGKGKRAKRDSTPPAFPTEPSSISVRIGTNAQRIDHLEREMLTMRHETAKKLEDLEESLDELSKSNAAITVLLPRVEQSIKDLREDLRDERRRLPTNKE